MLTRCACSLQVAAYDWLAVCMAAQGCPGPRHWLQHGYQLHACSTPAHAALRNRSAPRHHMPLTPPTSSCPCPPPQQDLDLPTFTKAVCAVLDIPVYDNPIDSLHLLFTTLLEFRSNPFFKQAAGGGSPGGMPSEGGRPWSEAGTAAGSTGGWGGPGGLGAPAMGSGVGRTLSRMMSTASSGSGNMARASPLGGNVNVMAF